MQEYVVCVSLLTWKATPDTILIKDEEDIDGCITPVGK